MSMALTVVRLAKVAEIVLGGKGLTLNQYRMLTFIDEGAPPLAELSQRLVMKKPNVSVLIDGLVNRGLSVRERDARDGRRKHLSLTEAGEQLLVEAEKACDRVLELLVERAGASSSPTKGLAAWTRVLDEVAVEGLRSELRAAGEIP